MTERLKSFVARHVFLPLQGMTLGDWWSLLRRHRFAIDGRHGFRALVRPPSAPPTRSTPGSSEGIYGRRIEGVVVPPPLFILGHYRSGTTHLHNLLALDPQFAAPTFFQVLNPHTFLTTERLAAPLADRLVVRRRFQDEVALGAGVPSEDEVALCTMTGLSPYMAWYFPRDGSGYGRYLTFGGVPDGEIARWKHALTTFLKKLTLKHGRPLVLKSPPAHRPHPAAAGPVPRRPVRPHPPGPLRRLPLDEAHDPHGPARLPTPGQPAAGRGRHDPRRLHRDVRRLLRSEGARSPKVGSATSATRTSCVSPWPWSARSIGRSGWRASRAVQPRLETYLGSISGYRKNRLDDLPEPLRRRIAHEWGRSFDEWGYGR